MNYTISRALPEDAHRLKALAVAAKAHWGYSAERRSILRNRSRPHAVGFYQHIGAAIVGQTQSDMGRMLPRMEIIL